MRAKERPANEVIQKADVGVEEDLKPLVTTVRLLCPLDGNGKLDDEPIQRELVHRVNRAELTDNEIETCAPNCKGSVDVPRILDLDSGPLLLLDLLFDLDRHYF